MFQSLDFVLEASVLSRQSNPFNTDTDGAIKSVRFNRVSIISGLNLEKMYGLSFSREKQTFRNNEMSVKWSLTVYHCYFI